MTFLPEVGVALIKYLHVIHKRGVSRHDQELATAGGEPCRCGFCRDGDPAAADEDPAFPMGGEGSHVGLSCCVGVRAKAELPESVG